MLECRYECVDWLFCNAGLMPVSGVNWRAFWPPTPRSPQPCPLPLSLQFLCSNLGYQLGTGGDLLPVADWQTADGLQQVFSTNLFGHFLMVYAPTLCCLLNLTLCPQLQQLEGFLSAQARDCHVIWTSSVTASRANLDPTDIQGKSR